MRRLLPLWLGALLCLTAGFHPAAAQDAPQRYEISNFDVTIQLRPDGAYDVTETLTYDFRQGTFSYAYRVLDADDASALRDVRVTSPDAAVDSLRRTEDDGDVRLRWTYPERSAPATFTIRYVVDGALYERGDRNVIDRDVLDAGATVPTRDVDVRVGLPASFDLTPDAISVDPDDGTVEAEGGAIVATFHRDRVEEGDEYPVEVSFPKRLPGQYWATLGDLVLALVLFLGTIGAGVTLNRRWRGARREQQAATRPPRDVGLPEAAVLLGKTATPLFTAVLFDLARRGHLTLRHDEESSWLGSDETVQLDLHPSPDDLSAFEKTVVEHLRDHDTVEAFWSDSGSFRDEQRRAARERVIDAGWMTAHRTRSTLCFAGSGAAVVGGIVIGVLTSGLATLLVVSAGLGSAIGALMAGARRYTVTEAGARRTAALRSFLDREKDAVDRLRNTDPARAAERLADALPWLMYHDDVSSAWLEEVKEALADADAAPDLPDGFVSLTKTDAPVPVAAFVPIVAVVGGMESSGAGAAGAAAAAGGAASAAGGGAAGAG
jgi:hypothetical protein